MSASDPIDRYLDQLLSELRGNARDVRRVLAEAEDHLREATHEGRRSHGMSELEAQTAALEAFGSAHLVARRFRSSVLTMPTWKTLRALGQAAVQLMVVGLLAMGASGLLSGVFRLAFGADMVAGAYFSVTYPAAAARHQANEVLAYQTAAGAVGLLLGTAVWVWRRRQPSSGHNGLTAGALPEGFVSIVGASVFGLAAAGLAVAFSSHVMAADGAGSGQFLSAAIVSATVFVVFALRLNRTLATRRHLG